MTRIRNFLACMLLAACSNLPQPETSRSVQTDISLPPMKTFSNTRVSQPSRSNKSIAADILDLTFALESGRELPVLTRFEGPITVRVSGRAPTHLGADLDRLISRFRAEAGIDISRVPSNVPASITVAVIDRRTLQRTVPEAACFVVPRMSSWEEFKANRRSAALDWTTLLVRERMAIFLPGDVSPQEVRDCLHEELAQAIGPLNDLYRLSDSVFNDDNFHAVLTGFDMLVLKAMYAPELRSGMRRSEVARLMPGILDRINPAGRTAPDGTIGATPRRWVEAIEAGLSPRGSTQRRRAAARAAVEISRAQGWTDTRLAFSLYVLGRLSIGAEPELAISSFLQAGSLYRQSPETDLQAAHVAMQLAAFALSAGQTDVALDIVNDSVGTVARAENAALLATLLMVKAEALDAEGRMVEANVVRQDALGWARYGFATDAEIRARLSEIASLNPTLRAENS